MHSEPRAHISNPQPLTAAKRQNMNLDITKPSPELQKQSTNTQSLETILKEKVIKEFVPQAKKEQRAPELIKIAYEPAKSTASTPPLASKPPLLVPAPSY